MKHLATGLAVTVATYAMVGDSLDGILSSDAWVVQRILVSILALSVVPVVLFFAHLTRHADAIGRHLCMGVAGAILGAYYALGIL